MIAFEIKRPGCLPPRPLFCVFQLPVIAAAMCRACPSFSKCSHSQLKRRHKKWRKELQGGGVRVMHFFSLFLVPPLKLTEGTFAQARTSSAHGNSYQRQLENKKKVAAARRGWEPSLLIANAITEVYK